jgi:hypothetical protein
MHRLSYIRSHFVQRRFEGLAFRQGFVDSIHVALQALPVADFAPQSVLLLFSEFLAISECCHS